MRNKDLVYRQVVYVNDDIVGGAIESMGGVVDIQILSQVILTVASCVLTWILRPYIKT